MERLHGRMVGMEREGEGGIGQRECRLRAGGSAEVRCGSSLEGAGAGPRGGWPQWAEEGALAGRQRDGAWEAQEVVDGGGHVCRTHETLHT